MLNGGGRNEKPCQEMGNIPQSYPIIIFILDAGTEASALNGAFF